MRRLRPHSLLIAAVLLLAAPASRAADTPAQTADTGEVAGQADLSSTVAPRWQRSNLTDDHAKVAHFVDSLLDSKTANPPPVPESGAGQ